MSSEHYQHHQPPSRIAFGACNDQDHQNDLWPIIIQRNPAAFVWAGDAIYADIQHPMDWSQFPPTANLECATPDRLEELYHQQRSVPGYRQLIEQQNVTIFGTFDDHDYGCNNADRTFPYKYESGKAFVNFLGYPEDSLMGRRAAAGHGVYGVKLFDFARPLGQHAVPDEQAMLDPDLLLWNRQGARGWRMAALNKNESPSSSGTGSSSSSHFASFSNQTVAVFVLDVRTHKTPWKQGQEAFRPDIAGDFLGERQWKWFEAAIRRSRAAVNVVVTGLQVHADRFPDGNVAEAWGKYPLAQQRLFDALLQDNVQAPILISGDVHMTQLMRKDCIRAADSKSSSKNKNNIKTPRMRSLIELTTSGMTHSWATQSRPLDSSPNFQFSLVDQYKTFVAGSLMRLLHWTCPWRDLLMSSLSPSSTLPLATTETAEASSPSLYENGGGENATTGLQFSLLKNFGELEFDWDQRTVTLRSIGEAHATSPPLLMARMSMDQLSGSAPMPGSKLKLEDFEAERNHRMAQGEWICINHRGRVNQLSHIIGHVTAGAVLTTLVPFPFVLPTYILLILIRRILRKPASSEERLTSKVKQVA